MTHAFLLVIMLFLATGCDSIRNAKAIQSAHDAWLEAVDRCGAQGGAACAEAEQRLEVLRIWVGVERSLQADMAAAIQRGMADNDARRVPREINCVNKERGIGRVQTTCQVLY